MSLDWASIETAIVLVLVALVFFGFVRERLPPEVVAFAAVGVLLATGILTTDEVLGVFGNGAPLTVAAMFVLSAALERTGVVDRLGRLVTSAAFTSPRMAVGMLMAGTMTLSAFVNNTPVVVILAPVVVALARSLSVAPSKLLIPLSFASIFGGTTTLIGTSTNLLVDGAAQASGLAPFGMFEITVAGSIMGGVGIVYMLFVGDRLLPDRPPIDRLAPSGADRSFLAEVLVPLDSPLVGKSPVSGFTEKRGFEVVEVIRGIRSLSLDDPGTLLRAGDRLVVRSGMADMLGLREAGDVLFGGGTVHAFEPISAQETVVMEGVVGPQSRSLGRRVADMNLRRLYGARILAVYRHREPLAANFDQVRLDVGDTVLIEGPPESMQVLFDRQELINISEPGERPLRRGKAPIAIVAVLLVMVLAAFEVLPIAALSLIAATVVIAAGCLGSNEAYAAIRWNILLLIFGMLALGTAMEKTGAASLIVENFAALLEGFGPIVVLSAVYLLTSILTEVMSNNAAAILLTPIAVGLAHQLGVDPRPFAVAVMFAASASFATPIGYQTNTFVYNVGGYRFTDFLKVGVPLNILLWATATLIIPWFWPLS